MKRRDQIRQRVMKRVRAELPPPDAELVVGACWVWTGPCSGNGRGGGYPRMCLDGQTVAVHRVMWTNENGFIPGKKQIDHKCRNRMCVNPDHLEMVMHRENQKRRDKANGNG